MRRIVLAVALLSAVAVAACADGDDDEGATSATAASPTASPTQSTALASPEPVPTRDPEAPEVTDLVFDPGYSLEIRNESAVPDPNGHVHIHGEIFNAGSIPLWGVEMAVTLYDENGVFWGTQVGYVSLPVLPPGDFSPYEVLTGPDFLPDGSTWRIEVTATTAPDWVPAPVTVLSGELVDEPARGRSRWSGQLRNDGTETLGTLVIVAPMYNADGDLVHEPFGRVNGPIEPGAVVDVAIASFQQPMVRWETFTVKVQELVEPE